MRSTCSIHGCPVCPRRKQTFTNESIHDFAEGIGIGPGIVVGRLQHDGVLERHQGNALKQKLGWSFASEG